MSLKIAMTEAEVKLLKSFLQMAQSYLEFGSGGSTVLAAQFCKKITSVDSSQDWLDKVRNSIGPETGIDLKTISVDIGPTREWGFPKETDLEKFRSYSSSVDGAWKNVDFILVDGRFRVACFARMCALGYCGPIAFHDYKIRDWYHVVETIATPIATANNLTVFLPNRQLGRLKAKQVWKNYRDDPR